MQEVSERYDAITGLEIGAALWLWTKYAQEKNAVLHSYSLYNFKVCT